MLSLDKMMMNVDSCCCGCSLRTGTLTLLSLGQIGAILQLFDLLWFEQDVKNVLVYFQFQFFLLMGITATFGLYGFSNRKPSFLLPYIHVNVVQMALYCILCFLLVFLALFLPKNANELIPAFSWPMICLLIFKGIFGPVVCWYFTSVVYRFYHQRAYGVHSYQEIT